MADAHVIGKYSLIGLLARGGMGDVYLARSGGLSGFNKLLVVKTLKTEFTEDAKFREMFLDEARLAARLNHRNIVQTNDVGDADGQYFLVMEFLDGRSLAALLKRAEQRDEKLPLAVHLRVIAEMLAGLHHAHELTDYDGKSLGVVHRDVCPANVLVSFDGQVRIVDFGVAKAKNQAHQTQAGTIKGRVAYMSPEHVNGKGLDRRADIFSAGIMVWEALAGRRFWGSQGEAELLGAMIRGEFQAFPEDSDAPPELIAIAEKALALAPADRYATAHEMRLALEGWLSLHEADALENFRPQFAKWFARERAQMAKLIEASTTANGEGELPTLAPEPVGSQSAVSGTDGSSFSRTGPTGSNTAQATPPTAVTSSQVIVVPPSRAPWAIVGIAVIALAGAAWKLSQKEPAPNAAASDSARLTIEATPANAQIFVDDAQVTGNPFTAVYSRGKAHSVRVVAPGYAAKAEHVDLTENVKLQISLDALPAPVDSSAPPQPSTASPASPKVLYVPTKGAPTATTAAAPATAEPAGTAPVRGVDSNNPYANPGTPTRPNHGVDTANPYK